MPDRFEKIETKPQQAQHNKSDHSGDWIAGIVIIFLILAITSNSPTQNKSKTNDTVADTTFVKLQSTPDTTHIEQVVSPFDITFEKLFKRTK